MEARCVQGLIEPVEYSSSPIAEVSGEGAGRDAGFTDTPGSKPEDVSPREECQTIGKDISSRPSRRMAGGKWARHLRW